MKATVYDVQPYTDHDTMVGFRCRDEAARVVYVYVPREQAEPLILAIQLGELPQIEASGNAATKTTSAGNTIAL